MESSKTSKEQKGFYPNHDWKSDGGSGDPAKKPRRGVKPGSSKESVVEKSLEPAVSFLKDINPTEKVLIVHGHDNDSITSAVMIHKLLKVLHGVNSELFCTVDNFAVREEDAEEIAKIGADKIIIVDIAHLESKHVEDVLSSNTTLIMDHHQPLKLKGIDYSNPRVFEPRIYMPVSYMTYRLYKKFADPSSVSWIPAVGVLSDHAVSIAGDLFEDLKKNNPRLIGDTALDEDSLFSYSLLGTLAKVFDSARIINGRMGAVLAARAMLGVRNFDDILRAKSDDAAKLLAWSDMVRRELDRLVQDFDRKKKLVKKNLIFYEIPSKLFIKSTLSGHLSQFYKDSILIIAQKSGDNLDISLRRGDNVKTDLNKLAKKATKGIPNSNGGGHEAAAGARIPIKYLQKFLKSL